MSNVQSFGLSGNSPSGPVDFLTGNSGGPVPPDSGNNINIIGGSGVVVNGDPGTNTLTISASGAEFSVGAFQSTPNDNGLILIASSLSVSAADDTHPGSISLDDQILGDGVKSFTQSPILPLSGIVIGNGASALSANTVSQHYALVGSSGNGVTSVTPSTAGFIFVSNGVGQDPSFQSIGTSALTLGTFGTGPNAKGASLVSGVLTLQPADGFNPGGINTLDQTFAGNKSFINSVSSPSFILTPGVGAVTIRAQNSTATYNFNLPNTVGAAGSFLTSQGGGATAMTWTTVSGLADSFVADDGTATPSGGVVNLFGSHGINSLASGHTVTYAVNNTLTLGDLTPNPSADTLVITSGDISITEGNLKLPAAALPLTTAGGAIYFNSTPTIWTDLSNMIVGYASAASLDVTSAGNTLIGTEVAVNTNGSANTIVGFQSLTSATGGNSNCTLGSSSLRFLLVGSANIAIGDSAGGNYTTNESSNILLGSPGVIGESNVMRLGIDGDIGVTYIYGVNSTGVASPRVVTASAVNSQIGIADAENNGVLISNNVADSYFLPNSSSPGYVLTSNTSAPPSWQPSTASAITYTNVVFSDSPYTVLVGDYYISVDSSGGPVVLKFPDAPTASEIWIIKDRTGNAVVNNITITTVTGAVLIDGATSFIIQTDYQSTSMIANATPAYELF